MPPQQLNLFMQIIAGKVPCYRVYEDEHVLAFLDVRPLSRGHTLLIPKEPAETLDALSEESAAAIGRVLPRLCRAVVQATGVRDYNVLQNNGTKAHQAVFHVHFHIIPKPSASQGLHIGWPAQELSESEGQRLSEKLRQAMMPAAA